MINKHFRQKIISAVRYKMEHRASRGNRFNITEKSYGSFKSGLGSWIVVDTKTKKQYYVSRVNDEYTGQIVWFVGKG